MHGSSSSATTCIWMQWMKQRCILVAICDVTSQRGIVIWQRNSLKWCWAALLRRDDYFGKGQKWGHAFQKAEIQNTNLFSRTQCRMWIRNSLTRSLWICDSKTFVWAPCNCFWYILRTTLDFHKSSVPRRCSHPRAEWKSSSNQCNRSCWILTPVEKSGN